MISEFHCYHHCNKSGRDFILHYLESRVWIINPNSLSEYVVFLEGSYYILSMHFPHKPNLNPGITEENFRKLTPGGIICPICKRNPARLQVCPHCGHENIIPCSSCQPTSRLCKFCEVAIPSGNNPDIS